MKVLFKDVWKLTPEQSRTNILVPFTVPCEFERLELRCQYSPKVVEDPAVAFQQIESCIQKYVRPEERPEVIRIEDYDIPVNFVTLSLDCGTEYIGCAHRHAPEQTIFVGAQGATVGFFAHPIVPGEWRAVLNVHAVISNTVEYGLTIVGKEFGET